MITLAQTETSTNLGAILGNHARKVVELRKGIACAMAEQWSVEK